MGKMATIRSSREIDSVFRVGQRASSPLVILIAARASERSAQSARVAVAAGKRLGGAAMRNRSKRVLRETARRAGAPWAGFDVVLVATPRTAAASADQLGAALASLLIRAGVIR